MNNNPDWMLSMVVDDVLRRSKHALVWVKKSKENSSSKKVGEVWEGQGIWGAEQRR